jgi:hypothetical protein
MLTHMFQKKIKQAVVDMIQGKLKGFGSYFNEQIITLIEQAKTSSGTISKMAREKTETARQGIQDLKIRAQEKKEEAKNRDEVQETKAEAKSTVKIALARASEQVQHKLDEAKGDIEQKRRERELDRAMGRDPLAPTTSSAVPQTAQLVDVDSMLAPSSASMVPQTPPLAPTPAAPVEYNGNIPIAKPEDYPPLSTRGDVQSL